jgi:hypothetical protein
MTGDPLSTGKSESDESASGTGTSKTRPESETPDWTPAAKGTLELGFPPEMVGDWLASTKTLFSSETSLVIKPPDSGIARKGTPTAETAPKPGWSGK